MHSALAIIILVVLIPFIAIGQHTINGKISDQETGKPLVGAHIILENTFITAISTSSGQFSITGLKKGNYLVRVSYIGYETNISTIKLAHDTTLEINLKPSAIMAAEVIVTATRAATNSPTTYSTVTRKEIEQVNLGQDMPYLLQVSPSVVTTSDAGNGIGYSNLRIRGTDLTRINVTINGIPLNDAESHGVWWVDLPDFASSSESIQIQRGVGTSTNGAAAFGASINIRTDDPEANPYGEVSASAGSFDTYKTTFKAGTGLIKNKWAFDGRFSKIYSGGYIDRATADLYSYSLSGGYFGKNSIMRLMMFSGNEVTYQAWDGVPGYMLDTNRTYNGLGAYYAKNGNLQYYENQTDNYRQTHYHLNWLQNMGKNWNLAIALHYTRGFGYYEEYEMDQEFSDYGLEDAIIGNDTISLTDLIRQRYLDNHFYGFTFGLNFDNKNSVKATIGGALNYYDGNHYGEVIWSEIAVQFDKNYRWYESKSDKTDANMYGRINWQVAEKLNLYGDLQVRRINYSIDGIDNDLRDISQDHIYTFVNPKAGAYLSLNEHNEAYLSIAVGNREPNRSALIDANPARPRPTAESLYNAEAGYRLRIWTFSVSANLYYMYYHNQLVLTGRINDVGDPVMENVDKSHRAGLELAFAVRILKNLYWSFNTTTSINKILNFTEYVDYWDEWPDQIVNKLGKTDIAFSPALTGSSILYWAVFKNLNISLYSKYVGKQYIDNTSSDERKLDPYFVNDLLISYNLPVSSLKQVSFSLKINNFNNASYESNAWVYRYYSEGIYGVYDGYFPQAGINFLAGIDLKF
jgi:iron complex outermembrane recepter protein